MPKSPPTQLPIDSLQLQTLPEKGKAPVSRLRDVKSAHELYVQLRDADDTASANRATIQGMFDDVPPYNDADLISTGQGFRTNVNFGDAANLLEQSMSAYVDMLHSVENILTCKLNTKATVDPSDRVRMEEIIAEEATRTFRAWPMFNYNFLANCRSFIADGVSVCYFENEQDWRWRVASLSDFYFPRKTQASEGELEVACCRRSFQAHQLYSYIRDEKVAATLGWNVKAVRKAITDAAATSGSSFTSWEQLQHELKSNDISCGAKSSEIELVHMWVQEFDQKVSHFIFLANGESTDFLYRKIARFESMEEALIFFTYGIGTDGYYHSIRGLGYKILAPAQALNRLRCQIIDAAMLASSVMVQPATEEAAEDLGMTYFGAYAVITPGVKFVDRTAPNLQNAAIPVLQDMQGVLQSMSGQYTQNALNDTREKTKFEVASQLEALSKLSVTSMNLFYEPWQRLLRASFKRLCRRGYVKGEPGAAPALAFRERCEARGVPGAVIDMIDHGATRAVRAVGAGSQAARLVVFSELDAVAPSMDPKGRNQYLRERVATRVGWDQVDKYIPPSQDSRPTDDERFAEIENNIMRAQATPMTVRPNDNHIIHSQSHIEDMDRLVAAADAGQMTIAEITPPLSVMHAHTTEHLTMASGDASAGPLVPELLQRLQQLGEIVYNGVEHLKAQQREAMKNGEPGAEGTSLEAQKVTQELMRRVIEHQAKIKMAKENHELTMMIMEDKARRKAAIDDALAAAKIRRQSP